MVVHNPTFYTRIMAAKQANVPEHEAAWRGCLSWFSFSKGEEFTEVPQDLEGHVTLLKHEYGEVAIAN
jgi:hypothetical protein